VPDRHRPAPAIRRRDTRNTDVVRIRPRAHGFFALKQRRGGGERGDSNNFSADAATAEGSALALAPRSALTVPAAQSAAVRVPLFRAFFTESAPRAPPPDLFL